MNKNILYLLVIILASTGCELITIGVKKAPTTRVVINLNQKTPEGVLLLLKAELDSNNVWGAAQIIANNNGDKYLAIEKYQKHYDIFRVKRIFGNYPFEIVKSDSLNANSRKLSFEINYMKKYTMTAEKIDDLWYIIDLGLEYNNF